MSVTNISQIYISKMTAEDLENVVVVKIVNGSAPVVNETPEGEGDGE